MSRQNEWPYGYPYPYGPWHNHGQYPPHPSSYPHAEQPDTLANPKFLRGLITGAVLTYLVTNDKVQGAAIKGLVKAWTKAQGGFEEMKERFRDAEAELRAEQEQE
ncbi:hypothetical protein [Geothrix sp. 21YS21S-4]|uniref:hypothetical protein n=1 Tax=Geothrix sp. 21YS21S-4 TaxID=3068889 RepID=UPI0027BA4E6C|nr:hypothetical protein [Geothrix sp. 21YS21S-4]